jgi:hypothetical protein
MAKYYIKKSGFGRYKYNVTKRISEKKAEDLRAKGVTIYNSEEEAKGDCN